MFRQATAWWKSGARRDDDLHGFRALTNRIATARLPRVELGARRELRAQSRLAATSAIEIGQPVDRFFVNPAVVVKRRRATQSAAPGRLSSVIGAYPVVRHSGREANLNAQLRIGEISRFRVWSFGHPGTTVT